MDSRHEALKRRVENCYKAIKDADEELKKIRETECEHPETESVNYLWASGHIMSDTEVCVICGEVIKNPKIQQWYVTTLDSADSVELSE